MSAEMYVYLSLDELTEDPDEITRITGVTPTSVTRKGQIVGRSKTKARCDSWKLRLDAKSNFELEDLTHKLFAKFKNKRALKRAMSFAKTELVCVFYTHDREPTISLSPLTIAALARLGCGFSLDYYFLPVSDGQLS